MPQLPPPALRCSSRRETIEQVNSLLERVAAELPQETLEAIDASGRLEGAVRAQLHRTIAKVLPEATGRAFFISYDKDTWQRDRAES